MKRLLVSASAMALCCTPRISLAQDVFDLGTITVTANQTPTEIERVGVSVDVLDQGDLADAPTATIADTLRRLPGVSVTQTGPTGGVANLRLRGSAERFTAVYIDGIKVNDPSTTDNQFGHFGTLGLGGATRIEVLKGSQSALYGSSAVAGVINISTQPGADTPEGTQQTIDLSYGSFNTITSAYSLVQRTGDLILNFGISHAQSDGFSAADESLGNTEADSFDETRLTFGASYQATPALRIGVNGFIASAEAEFDEFGFVPEDGTPGDEFGTREERGLRLFAEIDAGGIWTHEVSLAYFNVDRTQTSLTTSAPFASPFNSRFEGERLRLDYLATAQINATTQLSLGVDAQDETATYANVTAGTQSIQTYGAFAELAYAPSDVLDIVGSVRADDHSLFGSQFTGRLAFAYRITPDLSLRGSVADGYRAPSIDELFGSYPAFGFAGNPNLQPETSRSYEVGADYVLAGGAELSATVFRTDIENLIGNNATFSSLLNRPGTSTRQGLELSADIPLSDRVRLSAAYTYLDATDASGAGLPRTPRHELYLGLDADLSGRLSGMVEVSFADDITADNFPAQNLANYTVVNAGLSYAINDQATAYVRVNNLFDEQYQTSAGYGTSDRAVFVGLRASF